MFRAVFAVGEGPFACSSRVFSNVFPVELLIFLLLLEWLGRGCMDHFFTCSHAFNGVGNEGDVRPYTA